MVAEHKPIIVGGQSIALYQEMFEDSTPALKQLGPVTSKDVDFHENDRAAKALEQGLIEGKLEFPDAGDATVNAGVVKGYLGGKLVVIDFMRALQGVDTKQMVQRAVTFSDEDNPEAAVTLMHPLDCLKGRLANINTLKRKSDNSLRQAEASVAILQAFIELEIGSGEIRKAQRNLADLEHVITDCHLGKDSHHEFGGRLQLQGILDYFVDHPDLDERWRNMTLAPIRARCADKERVELERREKFPAPVQSLTAVPDTLTISIDPRGPTTA